jgi:hypothetical protein
MRIPRALVLLFAGATVGCLALTHKDSWPCSVDTDCLDGQACVTGKCLSPGGCDQDSDCWYALVDPTSNVTVPLSCSDHRCSPNKCTADTQCGGFRCTGGSCAAPCHDDSACQPNYACAGGACEPRPCTDESQCGGYGCSSGTCGTTCYSAGNGKCASDYWCVTGGAGRNTCAQRPCTPGLGGQCDGFACTAGSCKSLCNTASDCEAGYSCAAGVCTCDPTNSCFPFGCRPGSCNTSCAANSDCVSPYTCHAGQCGQCLGQADQCGYQTDCAPSGCCNKSYDEYGTACSEVPPVDCSKVYGCYVSY